MKPKTYFGGEGAKAEKKKLLTDKDHARLQAMKDRNDGALPEWFGKRKTDGRPARTVRIFWIRKSTTKDEV